MLWRYSGSPKSRHKLTHFMDNENISIPEPMDDEEFEEFFKSFI